MQQGESIQGAINNASSGDEIIVGSGNYTEKIAVTKDDLIIRSDTGNPEDTIIGASNSSINVVYIRADNVTVSGFKIGANGYLDVTGIYLASCSDCIISNNNCSENYLGFYLSNSKNNTISNNIADSNDKYGIQLVRSESNSLLNNTANSNSYGIVLENNSSKNNLTENTVNSNVGHGFYLRNSSENTFTNNTAMKNNIGFYLANSNMSSVSGSDISKNINYGMWISHSNYNIISGTTANKTNCGIHLNSSDSNIIYGNIIVSNADSGISMCPACDNNTVFNNYLNNIYNADIDNTRNVWNVKKTEGKNIVGGPYIAGNFWASPGGGGFSENAEDENKDGIADVKYNETNITDYLPLVFVSGSEQQIFPAGKLNNGIKLIVVNNSISNNTKNNTTDENENKTNRSSENSSQ